MRRRMLAIAAMLFAAGDAAMAADSLATQPTDILSTLRKERPRVLLTPERLAEIKQQVQSDDAHRKVFESLRRRTEEILKKETVQFKIVGPRLLHESRKLLDNVSACALMYRLTGEKRYLDRAVLEMTTAAAFENWNPTHFLDTAEMTNGMAIGYDWLHADLSDEQRTTIRNAIVKHGLNEGMKCYRGEVSYGWWTKATHNWSQVCNGGLASGAIALADEERELAREILTRGLKATQGAFRHWDSEGGWDEGPGYWGYTTLYTAYYMAVLQSGLGSMQGLDKFGGLAKSGDFRMHFVGPTGETFNFADAGANAGTAPQMFFLSRTFDKPAWAWHHRQEKLESPLDLIWLDTRGDEPSKTGMPSDKLFPDAAVVFLRSAWNDRNATWLGIKGGDNKANHSHLDLGSFVLDAAGKRWAVELGIDNYNLPEYFGKARWTYYRLNTHGQNTVVIDGKNQPADAKARVVAFSHNGDPFAVIDLTPAYPMTKRSVRSVERSGQTITMTDSIDSGKPVDVVWQMHTLATVAIDGDVATLTRDGQTMKLHLRAEGTGAQGAAWDTSSAKQSPPQNPNEGINKLIVKAPGVTRLRLTVQFAPGAEAAPAPKALDADALLKQAVTR